MSHLPKNHSLIFLLENFSTSKELQQCRAQILQCHPVSSRAKANVFTMSSTACHAPDTVTLLTSVPVPLAFDLWTPATLTSFLSVKYSSYAPSFGTWHCCSLLTGLLSSRYPQASSVCTNVIFLMKLILTTLFQTATSFFTPLHPHPLYLEGADATGILIVPPPTLGSHLQQWWMGPHSFPC